MGNVVYKNRISDNVIQLSRYLLIGTVLYPIYCNYNATEMTEDQAKIELQNKVEAFQIPSDI